VTIEPAAARGANVRVIASDDVQCSDDHHRRRRTAATRRPRPGLALDLVTMGLRCDPAAYPDGVVGDIPRDARVEIQIGEPR
jgi:hypothetical protein